MKRSKIRYSLLSYFAFFCVIAVNFTISLLVYALISDKETWIVSIVMLSCIIGSSLICVGIDIIRRKLMIERPVDEILAATLKISKGEFDIQLNPNHAYSKQDSFDMIKDNINLMANELSKNEVLKNDFISNVSHEIKTPLNLILNYAKALQDETLDKETRDSYLNILMDASRRLTDLVSNILKLNRLEHQVFEPEQESFDLGEVLRLCILEYEEQMDSKGLELICDIEDIEAVSSKSYMEIVFKNLISNAIKFTEHGQIEISLKKEQGQVVFQISDTGCGISKETGNRIFDKFYQEDTSHAKEGNGLGLALVKRVIHLLGGEIEVESMLQKGTTFIVRFNL